MQIFLVGGAVRDTLLELPVKERDWVVVGATADDLLQRGFKPVGKAFPVFLHPKTHEEYALARTEKKTAKGYHGFIFDSSPQVTLEEDLSRRDLTINAMAQDNSGKLIDPFQGRQDLAARIFRHVSPAFAEDPVRILRVARFAARFAALNFTIAAETQTLMRTMVDAGEVDALVSDRVWAEMVRALNEPAASVFFTVLQSCGALERLFAQINRYWQQDGVLAQTLSQFEHCPITFGKFDKPTLRFAALMAAVAQLARQAAPEQDEMVAIQQLCKHYPLPRVCADLVFLCARYHPQMMAVSSTAPQEIVDVLTKLDAFRKPTRFAAYLLVQEALVRSLSVLQNGVFVQAELLRKALRLLQTIDTKALQAQGLQGQDFKAALNAQRVAVLEQHLDTCRK